MIGEDSYAGAIARCLHRFHVTPGVFLAMPEAERAFLLAALDAPESAGYAADTYD